MGDAMEEDTEAAVQQLATLMDEDEDDAGKQRNVVDLSETQCDANGSKKNDEPAVVTMTDDAEDSFSEKKDDHSEGEKKPDIVNDGAKRKRDDDMDDVEEKNDDGKNRGRDERSEKRSGGGDAPPEEGAPLERTSSHRRRRTETSDMQPHDAALVRRAIAKLPEHFEASVLALKGYVTARCTAAGPERAGKEIMEPLLISVKGDTEGTSTGPKVDAARDASIRLTADLCESTDVVFTMHQAESLVDKCIQPFVRSIKKQHFEQRDVDLAKRIASSLKKLAHAWPDLEKSPIFRRCMKMAKQVIEQRNNTSSGGHHRDSRGDAAKKNSHKMRRTSSTTSVRHSSSRKRKATAPTGPFDSSLQDPTGEDTGASQTDMDTDTDTMVIPPPPVPPIPSLTSEEVPLIPPPPADLLGENTTMRLSSTQRTPADMEAMALGLAAIQPPKDRDSVAVDKVPRSLSVGSNHGMGSTSPPRPGGGAGVASKNPGKDARYDGCRFAQDVMIQLRTPRDTKAAAFYYLHAFLLFAALEPRETAPEGAREAIDAGMAVLERKAAAQAASMATEYLKRHPLNLGRPSRGSMTMTLRDYYRDTLKSAALRAASDAYLAVLPSDELAALVLAAIHLAGKARDVAQRLTAIHDASRHALQKRSWPIALPWRDQILLAEFRLLRCLGFDLQVTDAKDVLDALCPNASDAETYLYEYQQQPTSSKNGSEDASFMQAPPPMPKAPRQPRAIDPRLKIDALDNVLATYAFEMTGLVAEHDPNQLVVAAVDCAWSHMAKKLPESLKGPDAKLKDDWLNAVLGACYDEQQTGDNTNSNSNNNNNNNNNNNETQQQHTVVQDFGAPKLTPPQSPAGTAAVPASPPAMSTTPQRKKARSSELSFGKVQIKGIISEIRAADRDKQVRFDRDQVARRLSMFDGADIRRARYQAALRAASAARDRLADDDLFRYVVRRGNDRLQSNGPAAGAVKPLSSSPLSKMPGDAVALDFTAKSLMMAPTTHRRRRDDEAGVVLYFSDDPELMKLFAKVRNDPLDLLVFPYRDGDANVREAMGIESSHTPRFTAGAKVAFPGVEAEFRADDDGRNIAQDEVETGLARHYLPVLYVVWPKADLDESKLGTKAVHDAQTRTRRLVDVLRGRVTKQLQEMRRREPVEPPRVARLSPASPPPPVQQQPIVLAPIILPPHRSGSPRKHRTLSDLSDNNNPPNGDRIGAPRFSSQSPEARGGRRRVNTDQDTLAALDASPRRSRSPGRRGRSPTARMTERDAEARSKLLSLVDDTARHMFTRAPETLQTRLAAKFADMGGRVRQPSAWLSAAIRMDAQTRRAQEDIDANRPRDDARRREHHDDGYQRRRDDHNDDHHRRDAPPPPPREDDDHHMVDDFASRQPSSRGVPHKLPYPEQRELLYRELRSDAKARLDSVPENIQREVVRTYHLSTMTIRKPTNWVLRTIEKAQDREHASLQRRYAQDPTFQKNRSHLQQILDGGARARFNDAPVDLQHTVVSQFNRDRYSITRPSTWVLRALGDLDDFPRHEYVLFNEVDDKAKECFNAANLTTRRRVAASFAAEFNAIRDSGGFRNASAWVMKLLADASKDDRADTSHGYRKDDRADTSSYGYRR